MEVSTMVRQGDEGTCVNEDAKTSWSELELGIWDMILEKLPCIERLRLRVVCKDWNRSDLRRVERKPYFVTILKSGIHVFQFLNGIVAYDIVSKSLSFEPLPPFKRHFTHIGFYLAPFAVQGLIFTNQPKASDCLGSKKQWCVYNIHTRSKHVLPEAPGSGSTLSRYFCGIMVDTSMKPYTFKLVVSYCTGEETQIYDSATRSWSSHPKSNPNSNSSLLLPYRFCGWYFCMCHKGCMYMSTTKAEDGVLVYSMEEDQWSKLSGSPFQGRARRTYMGAWDDRIFAVLQDVGAESITVWELNDATQQRWVEYARCSKAQYEQLMSYVDFVENYMFEIASVFSEEYVWMYNWHEGRLDALVLLNLKTREWEPVASIPNMIDETNEECESYLKCECWCK